MRVAVVGLGLIGGSVALAARERLQAEVSGWDPDATAVAAAVTRGAISSGAGSLASAVADADVVFTAAPVDVLPELVVEVLTHVRAAAVVSDVGSTKRTLVEAIADARFIGGHPLAGAETSGAQNASAELFAGSVWYLTPGAATSEHTVAVAEKLVSGLGASPTRVGAAEHDRLMAAVSHLPHVFANVLVAHALEVGVHDASGPSFRDATRVAGANPAMWSAIFTDNRDQLGAAIDDAIQRLERVRAWLADGDAGAVGDWCRDAEAERVRLNS